MNKVYEQGLNVNALKAEWWGKIVEQEIQVGTQASNAPAAQVLAVTVVVQ